MPLFNRNLHQVRVDNFPRKPINNAVGEALSSQTY